MIHQSQKTAIEEIIKKIEIPPTAYERADRRYQDMGEWFSSKESESHVYAPHIYPQGSFRLGTVIRPINDNEEYDLDMGCRMQIGVSKHTWTQRALKNLVRRDLEAYRKMRRIQRDLEAKHRCWCLHYADDLSFHMDVVPSIPEEVEIKKSLSESMERRGFTTTLAQSVAEHAGAITDDRRQNYAQLSNDWLISNSTGYAMWFESRIKLEPIQLQKSLNRASESISRIDKLPAREWKSTLQRSVQILKRHRDTMFANNVDVKPASIIITTLAAAAYNGESDVATATRNILDRMGNLVGTRKPRIPNPIHPEEDFADRWVYDPTKEEYFWRWLGKAKEDFALLGVRNDADYIIEKSLESFSADLDRSDLQRLLGASFQVAPSVSAASVIAPAIPGVQKSATGPRPLRDNPYA